VVLRGYIRRAGSLRMRGTRIRILLPAILSASRARRFLEMVMNADQRKGIYILGTAVSVFVLAIGFKWWLT
jgi:hypothetical protein